MLLPFSPPLLFSAWKFWAANYRAQLSQHCYSVPREHLSDITCCAFNCWELRWWGGRLVSVWSVSKWSRSVLSWFFVIPWTVACQTLPSMGFSRQEYWSGLPFPSPGDLLHPGIEPWSPTLQADSLPSEAPGKNKVKVAQLCPTLCDPMDYMEFSRPEYWGG